MSSETPPVQRAGSTPHSAPPSPYGRPYTVQALERGLLVLAVLRAGPEPDLGLADVAQRAGLHKSTVHRLLATLQRQGFVVRDPRTHRYGLGLAFLGFAHRAVERLDARRHALRVMQRLAVESGESVYLSVRSGGETVCVDEVVPPGGVTLGSNVGVALPLHVTASGKCLLAWLSEDRLRQTLQAMEAEPGLDRLALPRELARVRERGYATNDEETEPGVRYVAAPVFGPDGEAVATLSVGAPILRVTRAGLARLGGAAVRAAGRVSASLGYAAGEGGSPRAGAR